MGLNSPAEESEEENDEAPDGYEATLLSQSGWLDADFVELPPLTLKHIHQYFITGRLQKEHVTATKPFERGYKLFDAKKVQCLSLHNVTNTSVYCIICATVLPSRNLVHIKQQLPLTRQMGKFFMEVLPVLLVVQ